ncbi:MAG: hypothetical protein ACR2K2_07900 [Mycobacteriales bacterium]
MKVRGHGMAVDAPPGWEVRIGRRAPDGPAPAAQTLAGENWAAQTPAAQEPAAVPRPVLHAATIALPEVRGDFGGSVTGHLREQDVFVSLFEYGPQAVSSPLFATRGRPDPSAADFSPAGLQRSIAGQSGRQYFFQESGRAFCLYVVLGSHARRAGLVRQVRTLLAGLDLDAAAGS